MTQYFNRPPRIQPFELPEGEIPIPNPPTPSLGGGRLGMLTMALPLVTILGYSLVAGRAGNPLFLLPMGMAAVLTTAVAYLNWRRNRQQEDERQQQYQALLERLDQRMTTAHKTQLDFYTHNFPPPLVLTQIASGQTARLWERRAADPDFGLLRLGTGRIPSSVVFKPPSAEDTSAPHYVAAHTLAEKGAFLPDAPIAVPLRHLPALGIHGRDYSQMADFGRSLLAHLGTLYAPNEARLYIIGSPQARRQWEWARWLPHCATTRGDETSSDQLCFEPEQAGNFWGLLRAELERRQHRQQAEQTEDAALPWLVIMVDMAAPDMRASLLEEVAAQTTLAMLFSEGVSLGASAIFLMPDERTIPGECRAVISIDASGGDTFFRYAETGVNTTRRDGLADRFDVARADELARQLAPLAIRTTYGGDLPGALTLFDMIMDGHTVDDLHLTANWQASREQGVPWPEVAIGVSLGGKPLALYFEQNAGTGVHGLVAGTTGTGKSQLLMTLIIGLAVRYDPTIVNFVLVDYKGGTTFEAFRALPHTVDVITNLHGQAGTRAFTAIRAELNRRSTILKNARVHDIGEYQRQGYHHQQPLSHLFVIIDEFAEMIKDRPEFRTQLEGIARLGRALGVHLILATQRPGGLVSDQIRSNMKFRLCLRMETPEDSRELLGRADAAFLPQNIPGRAYIQVGSDSMQLFQVAQVGSPYQGPRIETGPPVVWLNRHRAMTHTPPATASETIADVIIGYADRVVRDDDLARPPRPWPDPLPPALALADLVPALGDWFDNQGMWRGIDWTGQTPGRQPMQAVIGLLDNPAQARQTPLALDFLHGHVVIFGASGWGKTTLMRSVIAALTASHTPAELHLYILDFGGRGLDVFGQLPHLGHYITPAESERVQRLLRRLGNLLESRKALFSQAQVSSLADYNQRRPEAVEPAVLLVLDNFAEFRESFPDELDSFTSLAREGRAYGLHILIAAEQVTAVPPKIYSLFTERLALRLADTSEYAAVVGRGLSDAAEVPGRGFIRYERVPLEFQVALPGRPATDSLSALTSAEGVETNADENIYLAGLAATMQTAWDGNHPDRIDILEQVIGLDRVLSTAGGLPVIGIQDSDLSPTAINLRAQGPHFVIVGPPMAGKTTALRTLTLALASAYTPQQIGLVLVDSRQTFFRYGGALSLADLPHVLDTITEPGQLDALIAHLRQMFAAGSAPGRELYVLIDNYDDFGAAISSFRTQAQQLAELARQHGADGLHFVVAVSTNLQRLTDDFIRQVQANRFGLGLDAGESPLLLGARMRGGPAVDFPPGRGYLVKSGRVALVQIATPQLEQHDLETSLDDWVQRISDPHSARAQWPALPETAAETE